MKLRKRDFAILIAGMVNHSVPALACSFAVPSCVSESNGRISMRVDELRETPNIVIFAEYSIDAVSLAKVFMVDCRSRQNVSVELAKGSNFAAPDLERSVEAFVVAATSDKSFTLAQIRDRLKAQGLEARLGKLSERHCGCTLPTMEIPECPE